MKEEFKEREYKEDSTRGSSLINPLNYKGDVLVQVWVDSRVLATLCRWLDGLVYYNDKLLVLTDLGLMFLYKWSTSTLLDTQFTSPTSTSSFSCQVS